MNDEVVRAVQIDPHASKVGGASADPMVGSTLRKVFDAAKARIRRMDIRFVAEEDPLRQTILEVCRDNGIEIPTLCHDPRMSPSGACRMCVVEVDGRPSPPTACTTLDGLIAYVRDRALARQP